MSCNFSKVVALLATMIVAACTTDADYSETDIETLQSMMAEGRLTAEELTAFYLDRIETIDRNGPALNSIIEVNPDALAIARELDQERADRGPRGPMHGIPVLLKANIDTADGMTTTAGSLALEGHVPPDDAFIVQRLREVGAVILGKTNLSEWANFRSSRSSSGWSSIGGQTKNAYDPRRNPCGSSSGSAVAVAASLASIAIGTETNGSVVCPASVNGIVGVKPSLGLVSRDGIIPIAHSQDTAGPMTRTVRDAALVMNAIVAKDDRDAMLVELFPAAVPDFTAGLSEDALQGARIGVLRNHRGAGRDPNVDAMIERSIATLKSLGAEVVDPVEVDMDGMGEAAGQVLRYEFKEDLRAYLEASAAPVRSLSEVIAFNEAHADTVMPIFGQERMLEAEAMGPLTDAAYREALEASKRISQGALNGALDVHNLDALIAPTRSPAWLTDHINGDQSSGISSSSLAAIAGYASITLPAGDVMGMPVGLSFIGGQFSDHRLIAYAYAFEQAGYRRKPPHYR